MRVWLSLVAPLYVVPEKHSVHQIVELFHERPVVGSAAVAESELGQLFEAPDGHGAIPPLASPIEEREDLADNVGHSGFHQLRAEQVGSNKKPQLSHV